MTVAMLAMLVTACGSEEVAEMSEEAERSPKMSDWSEGFEVWVNKNDSGVVRFSTS